MAPKIYRCTVDNYWGHIWREGMITSPIMPDAEQPPKDYFEEITSKGELKALQSTVDAEDDPNTFEAYTEAIRERQYTGEGMMASDDPKTMKLMDLKKYAYNKGVKHAYTQNRDLILEELESLK